MGMKAVLLHTVATAIMAYGYLNLKQLPVDKFINTQKGGHSQFLTIIGCVRLHLRQIPLLTISEAFGWLVRI